MCFSMGSLRRALKGSNASRTPLLESYWENANMKPPHTSSFHFTGCPSGQNTRSPSWSIGAFMEMLLTLAHRDVLTPKLRPRLTFTLRATGYSAMLYFFNTWSICKGTEEKCVSGTENWGWVIKQCFFVHCKFRFSSIQLWPAPTVST